MATEFTAATPLIPYHRRTENLASDVVVHRIHVGCSLSIRCQRTSLLPKRTRLTHICFQPRKADRGLPGIQIPAAACSLSIRLACRPVAAFVVALCSGATQNANEPGLPCPARAVCIVQTCRVFAFAKIIVRWHRRLPPPSRSAIYLQPTPPLTSLKHATDRVAHRLPTGVVSGSCVSQFHRFESSVGKQFSLHGNRASRCGGQAVLLYDPRLTDKVRRFDFSLRIQKIGLRRNGCLFPIPRRLSLPWNTFRYRPSQN